MGRNEQTKRDLQIADASLIVDNLAQVLVVRWGVRQLGEVQGQVMEPFLLVYSESDFVMGAARSHVLAVMQSMDDE